MYMIKPESFLQASCDDADIPLAGEITKDDFSLGQLTEYNLIVANPTTPAVMFHNLRRQTIILPFRKPVRGIKCTCVLQLELTVLYTCTAVCLTCLLYTSPSPRDATLSRMPSSA